ncbi:MAG: exo-beta-N-acetylmuramidase NamZ domain-containing protein [Limisphaerales bacterium]
MSLCIKTLLTLAVALPWTAWAAFKLGNEVLAAGQFKVLPGKRVGLLTNPSGANRHLRSTIEVLNAAPRIKLVVALFGPEHGTWNRSMATTSRACGSSPSPTSPITSCSAAR